MDPEMDALFPQALAARVRVRTQDGRWFEQVSTSVGSKEHPLSRDQVRDKFLDLVGETRWSEKASAIAGIIENMKNDADGTRVMQQFR